MQLDANIHVALAKNERRGSTYALYVSGSRCLKDQGCNVIA